jgi:DNA mismatch repair protein MutS2
VATDPRMMNAAVEFDLDRLRPLYKLHIGLPGRSFAIDVAYRLGIPPTIIQRSRELLGDSGAEVAALLGRLQVMEERRRVGVAEAARDREAAAASRQTAERLAADLRLEVAAIRAKAGRLVTEIAAEARRRAEATVADLRRGGGIRQAREAIHDLAQLPETRLEGVVGDREGPRDEGLAAPSRVEPGQRVRIRHLDQVGTVLSEANSQGVVEVQLPVGKTRVPLESLIVVGELSRHSIGGVTWTAGAGDALAPEINVIGCTVEEATGRVQQYIEDAVLGGLSQVRIIHGKGTGRLRKGLAEFLKGHPLVAGFHLASFEEGGAGATIVQLGPCEAGGTAGGVHPSASVRTG